MRTFVPLFTILIAAVPATAAAQEGPRRGAPVPARAVREASDARRAAVRQLASVRAPRAAADAIAAPPPKRPRGG